MTSDVVLFAFVLFALVSCHGGGAASGPGAPMLDGGGTAGDASASGALSLAQSIPLPGVQGRIDHLAIDLVGQRLLVAALGNDSVEVVDLARGAVARSIGGLSSPQGVAYVPGINQIYVASAGDGTVKIFDGQSYSLLTTIAFSGDADNLRYDPAANRVYVGYGPEDSRGPCLRHAVGLAFPGSAARRSVRLGALRRYPGSHAQLLGSAA